jgi:hypothetical protein
MPGRDDSARQRVIVPNHNPQQRVDWTSASIKTKRQPHPEVGVWSAETVFVCALALLGRPEQSFPAVQFIQKAPVGVSPSAEAYVLAEEKRVVLITSTWAFRTAEQAQNQCGQIDALRQIAGVLAHEEWHVRHGPDEEGAYDAQLTALTAIGAGPMLFNSVMRAKRRVADESRRRVAVAVTAQKAPDVVVHGTVAADRDGRQNGP